jgi:RNA polymerase sigma-70 factor (ECF subfamily)
VEFEPWYRELHPKLVAWLVVAGGDVELARDVAAEAFTRAYSSWARVVALESPDGWVWTVAYNVLRRHFRRRALRSLPLRQRTAVALRYVVDLPQAQIAAVMGVAPGTVSATLVAARKRLADALAPDDAEREIDCDAD